MLTLHHLEYSQSFRVLWLLEELGVDYELKLYDRDKKTLLAPASYKAISPLGTAPVITDGDVNLAETSAILDYILDTHPNAQMRPESGAANRTKFLFWFHASQGSLMPIALMTAVFNIMESRVPFFLKPMVKMIRLGADKGFIQPRLSALLTQAETDLNATEFFAGNELTLADILMSYPIEALYQRSHLGDYPNCNAWMERMHERDAFKIAKQKDGRDSAILPL